MDVKNIKIIYMDGSKMEKGQVIGAAIVEEQEKEGLYFSMDKRCTIFTAETAAIAKVILKNEKVNKDIII